MNDNSWQSQFRQVLDRGVAAWKQGRRSARTMFGAEDAEFLATIGCSSQELFDFVDDHLVWGEPDSATILAVTAIRRDYFFNVMGGKPTGRVVPMDSLPAKTAAVDGIAWLPRLIMKARLKLRGEMPADLMYGCAGDRAFLRRVRLDLPGFLRLVRESGGDDRRIIEAVKRSAEPQSGQARKPEPL